MNRNEIAICALDGAALLTVVICWALARRPFAYPVAISSLKLPSEGRAAASVKTFPHVRVHVGALVVVAACSGVAEVVLRRWGGGGYGRGLREFATFIGQSCVFFAVALVCGETNSVCSAFGAALWWRSCVAFQLADKASRSLEADRDDSAARVAHSNKHVQRSALAHDALFCGSVVGLLGWVAAENATTVDGAPPARTGWSFALVAALLGRSLCAYISWRFAISHHPTLAFWDAGVRCAAAAAVSHMLLL